MYESGENYLETILILQKRNGSVRSIDIASELEYARSSVSRAIGILEKKGYVSLEKNGNINLTRIGQEKAVSILSRHTLIADFFTKCLGIDFQTADTDACRIEHVISETTYLAMKKEVESKNG